MERPDAVLVLGLAAAAGGLAWSAPIAAGISCAAALVVLALGEARKRGRRSPSRWPALVAIAGAAAFAAGAARAGAVVARAEAARAQLLADGRWPSRCALAGEVVGSPARVGDAMRADVDVEGAACEHGTFRGRVTLHVPLDVRVALARGDRVRAVASLAPPYRFWNDDDPRPLQDRRGVLLTGGAEDVLVEAHGLGPGAWIDRARDRVRRRIDATFPDATSAMARALVLGEDDLASGDQRAFRRSGLAHLLAVSGMHLVLVVAGLVALLRTLLVRIEPIAARWDVSRIAAAIGLPCAWLYADFAGGSGSAVRAAWMTSAALLAAALARRTDAWRALGLSILVLTFVDPLVAYDVSFLLSAAATLGILALAGPIAARFPSWAGIVAKPLATTAAATIACAPILASMSGDLPIGGLFANVIAVPLGELAALPLCLLHALLAPVPAAESGCALAASGALAGVRAIARAFAAIPWSALPVPPPTAGEDATLALGAFAFARRRRVLGAACFVVLVLLEVLARARGAPSGVLRVTFLDVGQGDAALVDLPDGSAMLIDGGGLVGSPIDVGERVLAPLLRGRRRRELALVVLSHPHPDHYGGLRSGLTGVRVGALWDTGQGEAEHVAGPYADLLADLRARGTLVSRPSDVCGIHAIGGATVEVLAPCPGPSPDEGPNDNSFVVRVRFGDRAILFAGDAERHEEAALLASGASLRADVLKVGHHGSRTSSTPAFVAAVRPEIAVISCGVRNRFGHPNPATLATLAGVRVYRTDRDGAVTVVTDGRSLEVSVPLDHADVR